MLTEKVTVKANEIRVGDILRAVRGVTLGTLPAAVVLSVRVEQLPTADVAHVHAWQIEARIAHAVKIEAGAEVIVERYAPPPPLVSREELGHLVESALYLLETDRAAVDPVLSHGRRLALGAIVDRIAPPVAPTLDEALAALDGIMADPIIRGLHGEPIENARPILDRARRAGLLK